MPVGTSNIGVKFTPSSNNSVAMRMQLSQDPHWFYLVYRYNSATAAYEVDPFICPNCQGTMTVISVIEDAKELAKIIDWAKPCFRRNIAKIPK